MTYCFTTILSALTLVMQCEVLDPVRQSRRTLSDGHAYTQRAECGIQPTQVVIDVHITAS